ncbi:MAG: acyl-CoA dehydrogenase [Rhodospirillaceae bacterium]|nr:acyl-CoA dehydrogenase [Rhodospirillaceae bacterium]
MTTYSVPLREMRFVLHDVFGAADKLTALPGFADATADVMDAVLDECAKLCEGVLFPINQGGDQEGCTFKDGKVTTPKGFKEAYKQYAEGGWCGLTADPAFGGQGLPETIDYLVGEMVGSANLSLGLYPSLTQGTILALTALGTPEQKKVYLPKLVSGAWQGTMCLTESHSGSDLGLLRAKAVPNSDGSYSVTGTKIFISAGEHDMTENHVHLVLARLPDAPEGSRGISMFVVPKFLPNADGSPGKLNAAAAGSIEHKMGMKGSVTCVMNFDGAKGWLVGQPHKGLAGMFVMMNKERLFVGSQGISIGEVAYQSAAAYAKDRLQGRAAAAPARPDQPADPIIVHPDIRNRLLASRAIVEALRALAVWTHIHVDISHKHPDAKVRQHADDLVGLMTPIVKASGADYGSEISNACLQVLGGHGYIREHGIEQLVRDVRITQIYEGTNTIQALDLVGRKLGIDGGRLFTGWLKEVDDTLKRVSGRNDMAEFAAPLEDALERLKAATAWLLEESKHDLNARAAAANDYLRMFGLTTFAWMWVLMIEAALAKKGGDTEFTSTKLHVGRYFMQRLLPQVGGLDAVMRAGSKSLMALAEGAF